MMLEGKHALVTGGGTGIGLGIARALAQAGAAVTITGRRAEKLQSAAEASTGLHPLVMDVTDEAAIRDGFAQAVAARGPIAIFIANAGIAEGRALAKTDLAFWRQILSTNLDGAFLTIREALTSMNGLDWGRVIAVSSIAGLHGLKGAPAYTASKHGLTGLIRGLAVDYASKAITFNALCPAYVNTDIIPRNIASIMARTGFSEEKAREIMVGANPHGRLIEVEEVAEAALWLCSPGSGSVNGQAIEIAGGTF
ncbi:MAG: SDR family oxidoreductase [Pseudomonadota bacterium]